MKRYLIILTLYLCAVVPTMAQYYSVNYDKRTVEAMTAAFATEATTEAYYAEQVAKIREHYQAAEVAAAGIFTSKSVSYTHLDVYKRQGVAPLLSNIKSIKKMGNSKIDMNILAKRVELLEMRVKELTSVEPEALNERLSKIEERYFSNKEMLTTLSLIHISMLMVDIIWISFA